MKTRLHRLEIQNFKAFRDFSLNLEGRHLLVYGANGSGKSSLYWALYTFFQSASKPMQDVKKYFDPNGDQNLLNIHEDVAVKPGRIALSFSDSDRKTDSKFEISHTHHGTQDQPPILRGDLASDFITYRFFFGFSHFRNSQHFNLWSLFEREILPFCITTSFGAGELEAKWGELNGENPNPYGYRGRAGAKAFRDFNYKLRQYSNTIQNLLDMVSSEAQKFYAKHFSEDDSADVAFNMRIVRSASRQAGEEKISPPEIRLRLYVDGSEITRPQSYLNEAKMTQVALSIRLAASLVNLHDSDIKLLVLDDLLVSLDMSNRMKVVEILLSETFSDYQKIILTHEKGFFEEVRRMIAENHDDWCFRSLRGNPKEGIEIAEEKRPLEKAVDYLKGHDLEAAASQLRKAAEETAKKYRRVALGEIPASGKFHSLTHDLRDAKNHLLQQLPLSLYNQALEGIPEAHREKLVSVTDDDIDNDTSLSPEEKGRIKCQRGRLKRFLSDESWKALNTVEVIDQVLRMKDRVLNPASHWNETPLYQAEVQKALKLVERLESVLLKTQ